MTPKKVTKNQDPEGPITLPEAAQKHVQEIRGQMVSLQAQLQQFIDGLLIGMGLDIDKNPNVDLDAMTITFPKKEEA